MHKIITSFLFVSFFFLNQVTIVQADTILKKISFDDFDFKLVESGDKSVRSFLSFNKSPGDVKSFIVEDPTRIVIDVLGIPSNTARSIKISNSKVSRIRVGIHRDKTRIVLDSPHNGGIKISKKKEGSNISHAMIFENLKSAKINKKLEKKDVIDKGKLSASTTENKPKKIKPKTRVELSESSNTTKKPVKDKKTTDSPTKSKKVQESTKSTQTLASREKPPEPSPTTIKKSKESEIKKSESDPTEKKEVSTKTEDTELEGSGDGLSRIKAVVFQTTSDNFISSIVVSATKLGAYTFNRTKKNKFELVLDNSKLTGDHLNLPQYPPNSFDGFTYMYATEDKNKVIVHIHVEDNAKLSPFIANNKLWIKLQ